MGVVSETFNETEYEQGCRVILSELDKAGHFDSLKNLMRKHLGHVQWQEAFCKLSFVSELYYPAERGGSHRRIVPLAYIQSLCSLNDKIAGRPVFSKSEVQEMSSGAVSKRKQQGLIRKIHAAEKRLKDRRSVDIAFIVEPEKSATQPREASRTKK